MILSLKLCAGCIYARLYVYMHVKCISPRRSGNRRDPADRISFFLARQKERRNAYTDVPTPHGVSYGPILRTSTLGQVNIGSFRHAGRHTPMDPNGKCTCTADRNYPFLHDAFLPHISASGTNQPAYGHPMGAIAPSKQKKTGMRGGFRYFTSTWYGPMLSRGRQRKANKHSASQRKFIFAFQRI